MVTDYLVCTEDKLFAGRQQAALRKHLPRRRGRLAITTGEPDVAGEADSKICVKYSGWQEPARAH